MKRIFLILCSLCFVLCSFAEAKYVFYFIGDGMGSNQVLGAEMYRSALEGQPLGRVQTLMTTFPYSGHASSYSKSNGITDSSAAGTCLATGSKTKNGMLGLDQDSARLTTIAEELKKDGWGVGIMTTVAIDHATPAAFYAHVPKRSEYYKIGKQLPESDFDFFGGAGFHHPQGKKDNKDINLYRNAEEAGYTIAHGYEEAQAKMDAKKLILVQKDDDQGAKHGSNLPYAIDRKEGDLTLTQIVSIAIPFLEQRYDRFFMMVEGGMIDYACHSNDAATAFGEVWDMDEAMHLAYDFYLAHPDETLIVVTADHETGGLALGNSDYTLHLDELKQQKSSKESKKAIKKIDDKAHIGWTTHAHTAHAVPIFAIGAGAENFTGWHDNTEIVPLIKKAIKE